MRRPARGAIESKDEPQVGTSFQPGDGARSRIWLRLGNASTEEVARLLRERLDDLGRFEEQDEVTLLELGW